MAEGFPRGRRFAAFLLLYAIQGCVYGLTAFLATRLAASGASAGQLALLQWAALPAYFKFLFGPLVDAVPRHRFITLCGLLLCPLLLLVGRVAGGAGVPALALLALALNLLAGAQDVAIDCLVEESYAPAFAGDGVAAQNVGQVLGLLLAHPLCLLAHERGLADLAAFGRLYTAISVAATIALWRLVPAPPVAPPGPSLKQALAGFVGSPHSRAYALFLALPNFAAIAIGNTAQLQLLRAGFPAALLGRVALLATLGSVAVNALAARFDLFGRRAAVLRGTFLLRLCNAAAHGLVARRYLRGGDAASTCLLLQLLAALDALESIEFACKCRMNFRFADPQLLATHLALLNCAANLAPTLFPGLASALLHCLGARALLALCVLHATVAGPRTFGYLRELGRRQPADYRLRAYNR